MSLAYDIWMTQFLNGLQLSMLLFLLSIGLTIIFGLLHFVNLAHGALYMFGAYIGISLAAATGSYWLALVIAPLAVATIGAGLYVVLIRMMRHAGPMNQVLVTFGLMFIGIDAARLIWGDIALGLEPPAILTGPVAFLGVVYPAYRLFIIMAGLAAALILGFILTKTRIGATIRAAVENGDMATCLGIHVERLFFIVFCAGCALTGLAGVIAAPVFSAAPSMAVDILIPTLIVVIIGGVGHLRGALAGAFLVGFVQTFGAIFAPTTAALLIYLLTALILVFRPEGLFEAHR